MLVEVNSFSKKIFLLPFSQPACDKLKKTHLVPVRFCIE